MRVLLVAGTYPPGHCGVGDYTQGLAEALGSLPGVQVGVLTTADPGARTMGAVELLGAIKQWRFFELPKIITTLRRWRPTLIHIQYPSQGFFSSRLPSFLPIIFRLMGFTVIQTWHEPHGLRSILHFLLQTLGANGLIFVRPNYIKLLPSFFIRLISNHTKAIIPNASPLPLSSLSAVQRQTVKNRYLGAQKRLVVFFGFLYPNKGIELLFDIANPATDSVVIAGTGNHSSYRDQLTARARSKHWRDDQVHYTGFLPAPEAADLLAVADAVVLPFLDGGGNWNTSIHSARAQGTLVITTAIPARGDEPQDNLYTAAPSDVEAMRAALDRLAGRRAQPLSPEAQWHSIAQAHLAFYRQCAPALAGRPT